MLKTGFCKKVHIRGFVNEQRNVDYPPLQAYNLNFNPLILEPTHVILVLIACTSREGLKEPSPEVINLFSCSAPMSMKCIMLINVKMPTIVSILTFISILKARKVFIFQYIRFYEQFNSHT